METSLAHYKKTARLVIEDRMRNEGEGMTVGEIGRALKLSRYYASSIVRELAMSNQLRMQVIGKKTVYKPHVIGHLSDKERTMAQQHLEIIHHG